METLEHLSSAMIRLTPDAMHLEAYLPSDRYVAPGTHASLLAERCADLGLQLPLSVEEMEMLLPTYPRDVWFTLCSGDEPIPPTDGSVELMVPVPIGSTRQRVHGRRHAVRAGAVLARLHAGVPGGRGRDLRGREIPPRPAHEARLPRGANTAIGEDGKTLRACCDGEVLLRNLQIEIVPMHVHEGDLTAQDSPLVTQQAVFVTGAVREQARIEADGEIYVQGEVRNAQVWSRGQAITVVGAVSGTAQEPSVLRANGDILCGPVAHSRLTATGDIHLRGAARQSTLRAGGSAYLPDSLEASLLDVRLQIEGGLFPGQLSSTLPELAGTRQHVRVSMRLRALLAAHHSPPLVFRTCTILNMSVSGARCQFPHGDHRLEPGMLVQLKFMLPDSRDYTLVVARVAREITEHVIGLEFLQMTQRDQHHLTTYCLQLLLKRMHSQGSFPPLDDPKRQLQPL